MRRRGTKTRLRPLGRTVHSPSTPVCVQNAIPSRPIRRFGPFLPISHSLRIIQLVSLRLPGLHPQKKPSPSLFSEPGGGALPAPDLVLLFNAPLPSPPSLFCLLSHTTREIRYIRPTGPRHSESSTSYMAKFDPPKSPFCRFAGSSK